MIVVNSGKDIPFSIQLIKGDGDNDEQAIVTYTIYDNTGSTIVVSSKSSLWNNTLKNYFDNLDVSSDWADQSIGNYLVVWSITGAEAGFPTVKTENLAVVVGGEVGTGIDVNDAFKILLAQAAGIASGGGTPYIVFRDLDNSMNVIQATCDRKGNRSDITITV